MLATFIIEFGLAVYVLWRYKLNALSRLAVAVLLCLGTFQLAEYMVCGGLGLNTAEWSRLGYACITLLPVIGLHMILTIVGKKMFKLTSVAYASAILFVLFFMIAPEAINIQECRPNYAIFDLSDPSAYLFALYYCVWLFTAIVISLREAIRLPKLAKALYGMTAGYFVFMFPALVVNFLDPAAINGTPSIMCGFAIFLAAIIVGHVLPSLEAVKQVKERKS